MSNPAFLRNVAPGDSEFAKFAILQCWLEEACINAGISLVSTNQQAVLDEVRTGDTDLQKWQKVTSWAQLLANGVSGGIAPALTFVTVTSSGTLAANSFTTVNAAGATNQALPASPTKGQVCIVKSIGAGVATVTSVGAIIFSASAVSSYAVGANGQAATFSYDGTYWQVT